MADVNGDMYGGPLKGDAPVDNETAYSARDIRQWVLDTNPDAIANAGKAYQDFKNALNGSDDDDLLTFIRKIGNDLNNAWGGPKSGAWASQQQLSMLWSSAKQLVESADALGVSLKAHGEDDGDGSLKNLKKYFHIKDSGAGELWGLVSDPSPFDNDVWEQTRISPDNDFKYKGTDGDPPQAGSAADVQARQAINQIAQNKLRTHNGLNGGGGGGKGAPVNGFAAPTASINSTYTGMPGWLTMELPPGTLPPQSTPFGQQDPNNPAPTDPKNNPANTGNNGKPGSHGNSGNPGGPGSSPHYSPTNLPTTSTYHPTASGSVGTAGVLPSSTGHAGGTDLSQFTNPTTSTPGGTSLNNNPTTGLPTTGNPTTGLPTTGLPTTGNPITSPTTFPTTPTTFPTTPTTGLPGAGKLPGLPGLGGGKVPSVGSSPFSPGSGPGSEPNGLIGGAGPKVSPGSVNEAAAANASKALQAEQAEAMGAAAARGSGFMPMMPMAGGMGGQNGQDRERSAWLTEDEGLWESDDDVAPPLIG
jgi:hypothetical protein